MPNNFKFKKWIKEHKKEIRTAVIIAGVSVMSWGIGYEWSYLESACNLRRLHNKGIIKFFDPELGIEVNVVEAIEVINRTPK